ncbi:pentapeptide repeat-containing protein [Micromonospora rifamycinica]|uniref:pentapeptide repeat-containing protein n=1 Tax=Micromonospora rifamycinica TaxID=291594 RepID=UPI002E2BF8BE|nr:pentapeptide repeat-containing protein [Micromonospora rifamycinica]
MDMVERRLSRVSAIHRRWPFLLLAISTFAAFGVLAVLIGPAARWLTPLAGVSDKDIPASLNATRQTLLVAVAGIVTAVGLAFTARTFFLTRRGQWADRYGKAVTQLGSTEPMERVGGIYALERLMAESPQDHWTIVEVLATFVRRHAARTEEDESAGGELAAPAGVDVQSALTVLCRRPRRSETRALDLSGTNLCGTMMSDGYLPLTCFDNSYLKGADLSGANLRGASFLNADLTEALLVNSGLEDAFLTAADLSWAALAGARLDRASLVAARLGGTILEGARLYGALLTPPDVSGLTVDQLTTALLDDTTELPSYLATSSRPGRVARD